MRGRVAQLLRRVRRVAIAAAPSRPPRRWSDDLAEAGVSADEWVARRQSTGRLYVDLTDEHVARLCAEQPEFSQATIHAASRVIRHEFDLLGSGPYRPVDPDRPRSADGYQPIDWYLDPVSGLRFPKGIPHTDWNLEAMRPGRADIKLPWELARCQHWPVLGQAYRLSGDERYALEIARELRDFTEANPVGIGINWTCTMDVALRATNWALGLELIRSCGALPIEFWRDAYRALFDHGVFIERNLENKYEVTSNHFLSNVVGLFYLAVVFSDLPRGAVWQRNCRRWLAEEMKVQVLRDGADYESSVPYHRLVTELFLGAARLANYAGQPLPSAQLERLQQMVDFLAAVLRPDGLMPQVGDADDGRLHVVSGYGCWNPQDPRHLFGPAALVFHRPEWLQLAGRSGAWEAAWWGHDASALAASESPLHRDGVRHFRDAGLTVIRKRGSYLLITNGAVGTNGFGNHKHNDLLGFEYHVAHTPVIIDPGSYVYTSDPEARNSFRSTRSHNTLSVDGEEQNEFRPEWLFRMFEKATPEHLAIQERENTIEYRGRHTGYLRLGEPVMHERTFRFFPASISLTIVDSLEGEGTHRLLWHFHFAPGVEVTAQGSGRFDISARGMCLRLSAPSHLASKVLSSWYSPSYGVRHECVALDLEAVDRIGGRREYVFEIACTDAN